MGAIILREIGGSPPEAGPPQANIQNQQALIVGINAYPPGFRALENSIHDARELAETLHEDYGFRLLPNNAPLLDQAAGLTAIKEAVRTSLVTSDQATRWLFFFAGHGQVVDGVVYLIPADAIFGNLDTYLPLNWLLEQCRDSPLEEILFLIDACYSGWAMVRGESLEDRTPTPDETRVRQIISSGNPRQPVLDAGGTQHSIFTQALLDGLQGWSGIHEEDGRVRFTRLLDHLAYEIPRRLRAAGYDTFHQQPIGGYFIGNRERREFIFRATVQRLPPDLLRDIASEDPGRRASGLKQISNEISSYAFNPALFLQAIQITAQHIQSSETACQADTFDAKSLVSRASRSIEPVPFVRSQAVTTLGELLQVIMNSRLAETTGTDLKPAIQMLICALDDLPEVSRQAAHALSRLSLPDTAQPLLSRLIKNNSTLFLDLVEAIGAVGNDEITVECLKECLSQNRLVLFIGPDFPHDLTGLPDRKTLVQGLAEYAGTHLLESFAETAAATMHGDNRFLFTAYLRSAINDQLLQPGEIHRELALLKAPFWISGSYDNLLTKALSANTIVMGEDTKYWRLGQPVVVKIVGDPDSQRGLVVIKKDYEQLREDEGDRRLLLSFIREELTDKVVLFLGYDPASPDFHLLVKYILNGHLLGVDVRAFIAWPDRGPEYTWGDQLIHWLPDNGLDLIKHIVSLGPGSSPL